MKRLMFATAVAMVLVGCQTCNEPKDSETTFAEEALKPYVNNGELPGAINVFYNDGIQETCCIGYADAATKRPMTLDSVFMQCSQTKGFCGVTVAKLVEEGKLNLDDPVSKYLPEFKELWVQTAETNGTRTLTKAKNVLTVRMCMNHTGGFPFELPNFKAMGGWSRRMPLRSVAATAASLPLLFEPGPTHTYAYSNVGIDIGAAVVEVITGKRWEDYLKETVLDPLGMTSTGFWPTEDQLAEKVEMYNCVSNAPAEWVEFNASMGKPYSDDRVFPSAGAGIWTTARDQLKFYKMLMNLGVGENGVRILQEGTVKSLLAVSTRVKSLEGYSMGLNAPIEDKEDAWFGHGGAWGTFCSINWHKRQLKLWVVQQCGHPRPWLKAREEAANRFFKATIDNSGVDAYTGRMK